MRFNLIPLGPLDGHSILPYLWPQRLAVAYGEFNARFGTCAFLGLVLLSFAGLPIFAKLRAAAFRVMENIRILA